MIALPGKGICAHRGGCGTCPENTLASFRDAVRLGAQMIEFDIRRSRDGQLFLYHDLTLERLTGHCLRPEELTMDELRELEIRSHDSCQLKSEHITTMAEMLEIMPLNVWLLAHLHYGDTTVAEEVIRTILDHDHRLHQVVLATTPNKIEVARQMCPDILIANMDADPNTPEYVTESVAIKADFVRFYSDKWSDRPLTRSLVRQAKSAGIRVIYFEPMYPTDLASLYGMGVDFAVVDSVAEMMAAANELGIEPVEPVFPGPDVGQSILERAGE